MCPPFTQTTAFSLSRQWSMDLLMICWSAPSSCALCLWDRPNWKLECNTRSAAELPRQHSRPDLSPGLWVAIQTVRWNSARYAAGTRQLTSLDETARRPVETQNDRRGLLTNVRKKTSLQQSFAVATCIYLGSFVDKVNWCLAGFGYCRGRHYAFAEVHAVLHQTTTCNGLATRPFWVLMGGWTVNIFSSENQILSTLSRRRRRSKVLQHLILF